MPALRVALSLSALSLLLGACATGIIGPDFVAPAAPDVASYTAEPLPARTASANAAGAEAQTFQVGANVPDRWWTLFRSDTLNRLVDEALAANPSLAAAQSTLIAAQENQAATNRALLPSVNLPNVQAGASNDNPFTVVAGDLTVTYAVDVCCGAARTRESHEAQLARQVAALQASYLTLTANVVNAVIDLALLQERLNATRAVLGLQRELLAISEQRLALGDIAGADVAQQQSQVVNSEAQLVSLERQVAQQTNQLGLYLGRYPSEMERVSIDLNDLRLPTDIPVSLPSQLVAQRPDIVQATYSLHAATANVGASIANLLPQVSISGSFTPAGLAWNVAASIAQAAINGGANLRRTAAAEASLDAAASTYEATVLAAFVDVADSLNAITYDARLMALQVEAESASRRSLDLTRQQYELGTAAYSEVLSAEQSHRSAVTELLSSRADRLRDTVALYVALGGGWNG
ncbi:MAG: efflux transporter outer membrane subunit [Bauldia sp.]